MTVRYQNLKEEEKVEYWRSLIAHAKRVMLPWHKASQVLVDQYDNRAANSRERDLESDSLSGEEHTTRTKANLIYGWIDQSVANMVDREPVFRAQGTNRMGAAMQDSVSRVHNYYYRRTRQMRQDERICLDAFLMPYGVAKIGYSVDFDQRAQELLQPEAELEFGDPEDENLFLENGTPTLVTAEQDHVRHIAAHMEYVQDPTMPPELVGLFEQHIELHQMFVDRVRPDANVSVLHEAPYAIRWEPDKFWVDPNAQDGLNDARWIAFEWELPLDEVVANPAYSNTADLKPSNRMKNAPDKPDRLDVDPFDVVRGYEIWVKSFPVARGKFRPLLLTIAEDHPRFLQNDDSWPYDLEDYPAEVLSFQQSVRTWFNKPPLLQAGADTVQTIVNETMDAYLSIARKAKNLWLYDPAFIDAATLTNILQAPDGSVFAVKGLADREHSGRMIMPLPFHQIDSAKNALMQESQALFDRSAGTPQPVKLPGTDTATEASILDRRNTARENRRAALMSEFQVRKSTKFWQLVAQFRPRNLELIDPDINDILEITDDMIAGKYNLTLDISSQSSALAVERSQWMDLLNLFAGLTPLMTQTYGMPPNLPEIARRMLTRGFNEKAAEELLPMLNSSAQRLQEAGAVQGPQPQPGSGTAGVEQGQDPIRDAVSAGRQIGEADGPLNRDMFNRDNAPNAARMGGAAQRV